VARMHTNEYSDKQSGMAYVALLILLAIISTLGFAFLFKVGTLTSATMTRSTGMQAHYLAEAAVNHAMWRLLNEPFEGEIRVAHVNDDAQEKDDTHMELDRKNELGKKSYVGLRFLNVKIPQGAMIMHAHVEFKASDSDNNSTHLQIRGETTDDAARFTATDGDISNRPMTDPVVTWNNIPNWTKDESYQTPDLTSIIQDIVHRAGWSSGNALAILFRSTDLSGERRAYSYDVSPASAPLLYVAYEGGAIAADNVYYMHSLAGGRYGYKVRRHTKTTFATIATVGAIGDHVVHQSYVLYVKPNPILTSCQAKYVEMHQLYTPAVGGSWEVIDLGAGPYYVPARAVLEVAVTNINLASEKQGGVRAVGSKLDRRFDLHEAEGGGVDAVVMHVQADANSQIEYYAENKNDIEFVFLGYWTCANYVETYVSFIMGTPNTWLNHDLNTYGVGAGQMAEVVIANTAGAKDLGGGMRKVGSSLNRTLDQHRAESGGVDTSSMFVEASGDENATVEFFSKSAPDIDFYLVGYWSTPPGTYKELSDTLGSPLADQTWEDTDLSGFGVPAEAVVQVAMANRCETEENHMGLREKGSSLQRTINLQEAEGVGAAARSDIATIHVNAEENSIIEWYHEDVSDNHEYRLLGYWECVDTFGKDLAGHWKLDEDSGTTASDSSCNGNEGTLINMDPDTDWVPGNIYGALEFDGGTEYVVVPHDPSLSLINQLTVAAWIYKETTVGYDLVLSKGTSGDNQNYWFGTDDDKITFGFYDGGSKEFKFDANLQTDTWYHIAATFNNANDSVRIYLNGAEVDNWSPNEEPLTNTEDLYIGRSQYGEYWDGKLDDVRIYNRVLDQAEIQALYDEGS
jgi:hypothetical protein